MAKKWKPNKNEEYFFADYENGERMFLPFQEIYDSNDLDNFDIEIFQTKEKCQEFCDKLNEAINQVRKEYEK